VAVHAAGRTEMHAATAAAGEASFVHRQIKDEWIDG
jgi:hypothetical protein